MIKTITASSYKNMLDYGIKNLEKHINKVNDLNVFPVPDGDTGTNMVMTMKNGFASISEEARTLSQTAQEFATGVVFGARGNSGVIVSQFFNGISKCFKEHAEADIKLLSKALDMGVEYAHKAISKPVEGTILTVMRESSEKVRGSLDAIENINQAVDTFLKSAKISLENTPNLLPVLEKAGVVDSGGAGLVYFFEGVKKYLDGEQMDFSPSEAVESVQKIDYTAFNKNSLFELGYCTEALIQLTDGKADFDYTEFVSHLGELGDSLVTSFDSDKVKVHIHTKTPEQILSYCHGFGEFLTLKIENMSVQHTQRTKKYLCGEINENCKFACVAVAPDPIVQGMFVEMGVDCCILSAESPSSSEFIEAFKRTGAGEILVFPNTSNSILSAMQAASLYKGAKVTVLNCRSVAECYASLAIVDFDCEDTSEVVESVNETVTNIYVVSVVKASKNITYGKKSIVKNEFFALAGEDILVTGNELEGVAVQTVREVAEHRELSVLTVFCGKNVSKQQLDGFVEAVNALGLCIEIYVVPTEDRIYDLTLSFE